MNITQQTLEILIGKCLDGEITPGEQDLLNAALEEDSQARELFEQLQQLNQNSRQVVAAEILESGKQADDIFEQIVGEGAGMILLLHFRLNGAGYKDIDPHQQCAFFTHVCKHHHRLFTDGIQNDPMHLDL